MNHAVFFRAWLAAPLKIASLAPSGTSLCRDIAKHAYTGDHSVIAELGSGTGEITQALVAQGVAEENLYMFELMPEFCQILRRNFPSASVLEGDVCAQLDKFMRDPANTSRVTTVVSSLPIVWFPLAQQRSIIDQSFALMGSGGRFLQLTNLPTSPLPMKKLGLRGKPIIWKWNVSVPGVVWAYQRTDA